MKIRLFCYDGESVQIVGRSRFVGALVKIPIEFCTLKIIKPEEACWNLDGHAPANEISGNVWLAPCSDDGIDLLLRELFAVVSVWAACRKQKALACRFEVEVLCWIFRILQKNFDAGIFPAASAILVDFGTKAFCGFFDSEIYDKVIVPGFDFGEHRGENFPLILGPVHVCA